MSSLVIVDVAASVFEILSGKTNSSENAIHMTAWLTRLGACLSLKL